MCLDIFRNPGKALAAAAKKKDMKKTAIILVESAIMAAAAMVVISIGNAGAALAVLAGNVLFLVIAVGIIGGYALKIAANALGLKGGFYEGLTAISYAFVPVAAGILIATVLSRIPLGIVAGAIALALMFSMGVAILYRGIREMFKTDMITSFVCVSIITLAFVIGLYASLGLNMLVNVGRLLPI